MFILKTIQILTSFGNKQNSLLFPIGEFLFPNCFWIPITEVNFPTNFFWYSSR